MKTEKKELCTQKAHMPPAGPLSPATSFFTFMEIVLETIIFCMDKPIISLHKK